MPSKLIFTPIQGAEVYIPAPSHGPNIFYKVSAGDEDWGNRLVRSVKIQMYKGRTMGRQSPTFPCPKELEEVLRAVTEMSETYL